MKFFRESLAVGFIVVLLIAHRSTTGVSRSNADHIDKSFGHHLKYESLVEDKTQVESHNHHIKLRQDVVFFIMTSAEISRKRYKNKNLFAERAKPAMRTWAADFPHVYFVMEYSQAAASEFVDCTHKHTENEDMSVVRCKENSHPVLLVKCSNEYWGRNGPCCKCEEALKFAVSIPKYEFDWVVFSDDDMYYDPSAFTHFLRRHDPSVPQVMGPNSPLGSFTVYPSRTHCTHPGAKSITLQPVVISHAALLRVELSVRQGGITSICSNFNSTHDAALGVFFWMHGISLQRELGSMLAGLEKWTRESAPSDKFIIHRVKFERDFDYVNETLSVPFSTDGANIPIEKSQSRRKSALDMLSELRAPMPVEQLGYLSTTHHLHRLGNIDRSYGVGDHRDRSEWPAFTASDCMTET